MAILLHLGRVYLKLSQLQDKKNPEMETGRVLMTCYEYLDLAKSEARDPCIFRCGSVLASYGCYNKAAQPRLLKTTETCYLPVWRLEA